MAEKTTHYQLNVPTGSDIFNPLTLTGPNFHKIDDAIYNNETHAIYSATELYTAQQHRITRLKKTTNFFKFQSTSEWHAGDTVTVDGQLVNPVMADGTAMVEGAYKSGAYLLCSLDGSTLTVYVAASSSDAQTLEGHPASYFGTAIDTAANEKLATAAHTVANDAALAADNAAAAARAAQDTADQALAQGGGIAWKKIWTNPSQFTAFQRTGSLQISAPINHWIAVEFWSDTKTNYKTKSSIVAYRFDSSTTFQITLISGFSYQGGWNNFMHRALIFSAGDSLTVNVGVPYGAPNSDESDFRSVPIAIYTDE